MEHLLRTRASHAHVDFLGELTLSCLLGMLEQAAVEASTGAGLGPGEYAELGGVWIIRRTRLTRIQPIGGLDDVEITTRLEDCRRARSLRSYQVRRRGQEGRDWVPVAEATTDWVYCDLSSGRPRRVPESVQSALSGGKELPTLDRWSRLRAPDRAADATARRTVQVSDLDHVVHVNNARYADFLEDAAMGLFAAQGRKLAEMLDSGGALRPDMVDMEYVDDARPDDALVIRSWCLGERGEGEPAAHLFQTVHREDGSEVLRAESRWGWRRSTPVLGARPAAPFGADSADRI